MKRLILLMLLILGCTTMLWAQGKSDITSMGANLILGVNQQTQTTDLGLSIQVTLTGIDQAASLSVGTGTTALAVDGVAVAFDVLKDKNKYYMVKQNLRTEIVGGKTVTVLVHLTGSRDDYRGKYAIVSITDKEGHASPLQALLIR